MRRLRLVVPLALVVLCADCSTKELAVEHIFPEHTPREVLGDVVRFTLVYNPGAAMSIPVGGESRWPLIGIGLLVLAALVTMAWRTPPQDATRRIALGLLIGGALGNLVSRAFTPRGVVDFIDLGVGPWRFFVCNVADIGITAGACLLAYTLWREAQDEPHAQQLTMQG